MWVILHQCHELLWVRNISVPTVRQNQRQNSFIDGKSYLSRGIFFIISNKRTRFHITLFLLAFFMYFFYGEFVYFLSMLPMKKKKRRYWINLYIFSLTMIGIITLYKKRSDIRRFLGMRWALSTIKSFANNYQTWIFKVMIISTIYLTFPFKK